MVDRGIGVSIVLDDGVLLGDDPWKINSMEFWANIQAVGLMASDEGGVQADESELAVLLHLVEEGLL